MNKADALSVATDMKTSSGLFWPTPVLNLVSAVITETGGLLSHAAIIAREYGIPAVLNVNDATALLRDDQTIEVDGDKGEVRIV